MTKYLKIMLTITLFFGACAGLTWYVVSFHAGDFLKDKLHAISERHGYELQTESIHVFPAGLVSMHGIKIRNVNEEENFLSISKVMCSFRPLAIFSESRLAPSCYVEGALLKDSPKGILDRLRDVTEKLNKNTDSTVGGRSRKFVWRLRRFAVEMDVGRSLGNGNGPCSCRRRPDRLLSTR